MIIQIQVLWMHGLMFFRAALRPAYFVACRIRGLVSGDPGTLTILLKQIIVRRRAVCYHGEEVCPTPAFHHVKFQRHEIIAREADMQASDTWKR